VDLLVGDGQQGVRYQFRFGPPEPVDGGFGDPCCRRHLGEADPLVALVEE
jgi:hypothetical protein